MVNLAPQGAVKIQVRIIEYTIDSDSEPKTYRLITSLMDLTVFPALLLAAEYHQRWEIESTIAQLKTHLLGRQTPIRSLKPREVVQEIYGWLLVQGVHPLFNVSSGRNSGNFTVTDWLYWYSECDEAGNS